MLVCKKILDSTSGVIFMMGRAVLGITEITRDTRSPPNEKVYVMGSFKNFLPSFSTPYIGRYIRNTASIAGEK